MVPATEQEKASIATPTWDRNRSFFARNSASNVNDEERTAVDEDGEKESRPTKWSMGVLNDPDTHEVPGSILLLTGDHNQPLGLRNAPARTSTSSIPQPPGSPTKPRRQSRKEREQEGKKTTPDGAIILDPQPDESNNDPLNWPKWRRDCSLLSLGLYCMVGGGMTPVLAAGFTNVASTYNVTVPKVALTTGLYMMGLGVGSVIVSPTAILFGKRPVYLASAILFVATSVWCAASPSYNSLLVARIIQGISVSPVECLPSATIAEIFFLHERAYRIGIYTLLLLGGKNLVPLVSAAIIQSLSWRWVFWIVSMVVGFVGVLLFFFLPESFWDRTPRPKSRKPSRNVSRNASRVSLFSSKKNFHAVPNMKESSQVDGTTDDGRTGKLAIKNLPTLELPQRPSSAQTSARNHHVGFAGDEVEKKDIEGQKGDGHLLTPDQVHVAKTGSGRNGLKLNHTLPSPGSFDPAHEFRDRVTPVGGAPPTPALHTLNSPFYSDCESGTGDYLTSRPTHQTYTEHLPRISDNEETPPVALPMVLPTEKSPVVKPYTHHLRQRPPLTFVQQLKPFNGRLTHDNWFKVALRPFILFAYPAVLWSAGVYSCAVGWLIVLSESVAVVYRSKDTYGFSALSTGLIYLSPFIGGVLGTAVAGKVSDIIVRAMSRRNGGLYEPEFRLVMAAPVALTTVIGLMGFGWSVQVHDSWIVPTIFFGIISFGCSLGSTTAITFCVDSYRQYAGEALVTLNFSKNIFHGLVFSLFFNEWLTDEGTKMVFIWLGVIQLILMASSVPMYIFGKRARMWTVRKNLMEKL
ncbi:putative MFS-type transporter [Lachnellula occidentalis]|uniref:Putative MFS-type transporter n=1 Tax=Lachnellula occidentalis TaxID=215460 RepID=A0A8H8UE36_9HELO|nr:putative MFS-type transporter [Lachnellula occidentalis]